MITFCIGQEKKTWSTSEELGEDWRFWAVNTFAARKKFVTLNSIAEGEFPSPWNSDKPAATVCHVRNAFDMVAFLRHTGEERLDSFIITLSCCLWTDAHVHQPSWSSLASVLWKCKVITGVYLGQKKRTQFQAQTLFLCCFSMVYFWLQNSSLSVPNPLLREWGGSSLCLSVYYFVRLCVSLFDLCKRLWGRKTYRDSVKFLMILPESCMNKRTTSSTKSGELSSCNCCSSENWSSSKPCKSIRYYS